MQMVALKGMKYNGRDLRPGDRFEAVSERAARLFTLSKRARAEASDPADEAPRKRRYARRDLQAQD